MNTHDKLDSDDHSSMVTTPTVAALLVGPTRAYLSSSSSTPVHSRYVVRFNRLPLVGVATWLDVFAVGVIKCLFAQFS